MLQLLAGKDASKGSVRFERHRPEQTLLYRLVEQYYPDFERQWASEGRVLPDYVRQEFDDYLKCGRLEHGFLRVQCETCHAEHLVAFSCKRRDFVPAAADAAWLKVPPCWWMKCCRINPCANGCSVCRSLSGFYLPANPRLWARRWALFIAPLPHT